MKQIIKDKIDNLPLLPGCYLMKDKTGKIIYVGKAKKLKNRIPCINLFHSEKLKLNDKKKGRG